MFRKILALSFVCLFSQLTMKAQTNKLAASDIQLKIQKLDTLGSVLYFAAHPDDENTRLIAWLAQEKKYRTAYLSLTRGDGGQNLIGTQQGIDLGLIRTQELLSARSIDKGEQFFSSAYDFGFSKTPKETFDFWDKETALREAVWIIRKFQPDVIITRFPPDERGGHGHHQASAMLAHEAYIAAADPNIFPAQLEFFKPWKAKRLVWNAANFGGANSTNESQLKVDIGAYSALLGLSYGEIAAHSRSQHKSQGFGAASTRGSSIEYFEHVAGDKAVNTLFDGVETSWHRIPGSDAIQKLIQEISTQFSPTHPEQSITKLFKLRNQLLGMKDEYWRNQKVKEVEEIIIACAGLYLEASTNTYQQTNGVPFDVNLEAVVRNPNTGVQIIKTNLASINQELKTNQVWRSQASYISKETTQPYWLINPHSLGKFEIKSSDIGYPENKDLPSIVFSLSIDGQPINVEQRIRFKTVDPVQGELYQPVAVLPAITAALNTNQLLFTDNESKSVEIVFQQNNKDIKDYTIHVGQPAGWTVSPQTFDISFSASNTNAKTLTIKPTSAQPKPANIDLKWDNQPLKSITTINYEHIPTITWFPSIQLTAQKIDLINPVKKVGYIHGAGDLVPQALQQIGIETTLLDDKQLNANILNQFDAIILGIRYYNISPQGSHVSKLLLDYVEQGGVVLSQYHVNSRLQTSQLGPYPFNLSRTRVTEENAEVKFDANDPAFTTPNKITSSDFNGWVQERGLYFADKIDNKYRTPIRIHDTNEPDSNGSLLIAKYGKGKFVYTSLAFFRQLPAGVPGAYRLFVNLLTKEK